VIFESGVDSDPVTMVLVSDSNLSEADTINHFSDDDSDDDNDDDDDDDDDGRGGGVEEVESDDTEVSKVYEMWISGTVQQPHSLSVYV
jgi:hypothetical protein